VGNVNVLCTARLSHRLTVGKINLSVCATGWMILYLTAANARDNILAPHGLNFSV
jgi:predicted thioesterase